MPQGVSLFEADYAPFFHHSDVVLFFKHPFQFSLQSIVGLHDVVEACYFRCECPVPKLRNCRVDLAVPLVTPLECREAPVVVAGAVLLPVIVRGGMQG